MAPRVMPLRLLHIDDSEAATARLVAALREGGLEAHAERVATAAELAAALAAGPWEACVASEGCARLDPLAALAQVRAAAPDLPFIVLSETGDEARAVAALEAGADDFITWGRLRRLAPAIRRERRQAEARRASQAHLAALIDSAMDAIITVDDSQRIVLFNAAAERMFGYPAAEVRGQPLDKLLPERYRAAHRRQVDRFGQTGQTTRGMGALNPLAALRANGVEFAVEAAISQTEHGGQKRYTVILRDVTARQAAEARITRQVAQLAALRAIDLAITSSLDLRPMLAVLLEQVTAQLAVDAADVLLLDPLLQRLSFAAGRGFRTRPAEHFELRLGESLAGQAALERHPVEVANLQAARAQFVRAPLIQAEGFDHYVAVPLVTKGHVVGVMECFHRAPLRVDDDWRSFLEVLAGQAAIAVESTRLFEDLQRSNAYLTHAYDATIEGWSRALDLRDKETEGHTQRVTDLTLRLAQAMGLPEADLVHVRRGALLHDIGKMGVPDGILLKPGPLNEVEQAVMQQHPTLAYELLSPISFLRPALDIPYCHHEKWDGTGYPRQLKGDEIPLSARLFAVVDVWDALGSERPYRPAWSAEEVQAHLRAGAGTHFDPRVVEAFLAMMS